MIKEWELHIGEDYICIDQGDREVLPETHWDVNDRRKMLDARLLGASDKLLRELTANRDMLVELRDKHLNHTAAVVRALVQKRIDAADKAINLVYLKAKRVAA